MSKKELMLKDFFQIVTNRNLSPNQFYVLCSMRENTVPANINVHLELRELESKGWITLDKKITADGLTFINEVEGLFAQQTIKNTKDLLGDDFSANIEKYNEMFPSGKLPSGKLARSAKGNLENAFKWFFQNYKFSWEVIFKATAIYLDEYEAKNWYYCRTSQYFIRKQASDKTWDSELANYCTMVVKGDEGIVSHHFSEKVV